MISDELVPAPQAVEAFRRDREKHVPNRSGCYVLTTFERAVLYVGLATDLRTRFSQHLDDPKKTGLTDMGRAVLFHWFETKEIQKVERTWLNIHYQFEGKRPILNSIDSPINA